MATSLTPWQRAHAALGLSGSKLAALLGRHRSKVSRALKDDDGLISGRDQVLLLAVAKGIGVELRPADLVKTEQ